MSYNIRGSMGKFVSNNPWSKFVREWNNFWKKVSKILGL